MNGLADIMTPMLWYQADAHGGGDPAPITGANICIDFGTSAGYGYD